MSDLPPPQQSLRVALSVHALIAVGILLLVALTGGAAWKALAVAAAIRDGSLVAAVEADAGELA